MKKLLIALLILPITSNAVDWIDLGKSEDKQGQSFLDYDSVKRQNIRVVGSSSFNSPRDKPEYISAIFQATYINNNPLRKKGLYYSKQQWFISCEDQTYFINARIDYGFKDEVISSWQSPKIGLLESDFSYAFPETVGGDNIANACASIAIKETEILDNYDDYMESLMLNSN